MAEKPIIYTTPTCPYCDKVKEFLSQKGLVFEEVDVASDPQARQELIQKGYRGVPVTVIGEEEILGFDVAKLEEAIAKAGI
ncbi:MAG: glutaredoxin family protein [bacterium]|jgi:glutaredoxin 3|nr:glutaredoxin family protein [Bacillota bacterium]HHW55327.1 glutaredoxin family protein [Bacillota bacterium]